MARYDVDIQVQPGEHVRRKVRAKSGHAAYERVMCEHLERGGPMSMELAVVTRRGLRFGPGRRRSTVLTGQPPSDEGGGGLAGVREPRRPKPAPPSLRATRDVA